METDFFISHAGEDKDAVARPLAKELRQRGCTVWYDEFVLSVGDSLSESIDEGLANCRYAIVILSDHFFEKSWPKRELAGLAAREVEEDNKVILPVWHEISSHKVKKIFTYPSRQGSY